MHRTTILIADDHALVREGIATILSHFDDIEVIGQACDGREAIDRAGQLRPDIILMDIAMPGLGGLEATLEIRKTHPEIRIIVLSQYEDKEYVSRFLKAGVSGYVLKKAVGDELISAIRSVVKGGSYLYPSIAASVIDSYVGNRKPMVEDPYDSLTPREKQVIKLLADGCSHKQLAGILNISVKTVIAHQSHITEKLDIHNRADLIKFAIRRGIIKVNQISSEPPE